MQPTTNDIAYDPGSRTRARSVPVGGSRRKRSAGHTVSIEGLLGCFAITAGGLGATAALGGLRIADLVITGLVMVGCIILATRDSRFLMVAVFAAWMFTPLVRRIVDWQSGGYTSITALSLLPMMVTSAIAIPLYPRRRQVPRRLGQPLLLMALPVAVAAAYGVIRYGPGAVLEAAGWLMPLIAVPYLATRPTTPDEKRWLIRAAVLLAALASLYGIYQFMFLPIWDAIWLAQSGMMSSMGRPVAMEIRVWGPLNDCGSAATVWALAIVAAFAERRWHPAVRYPVIALHLLALSVTFVRIGWIMAVGGLLIQVVLSGRRGGISIAASVVVALAALTLALPYLPQGGKVLDRLVSFSDLENDTSYQSRAMSTQEMLRQVATQPFGIGMGYRTAAKISGSSTEIVAVDNGYADLLMTLGWVGAICYAYGFAGLFGVGWRAIARDRRAWSPGEFGALACASLATVAICTLASFSMVGILAIWSGGCTGLATVPTGGAGPARERPTGIPEPA